MEGPNQRDIEMTDATVAQLRQQQRHIPARKESRPVNRDEREGTSTSAPEQNPAASGNTINEEWLHKGKESRRIDDNDPEFPCTNDISPEHQAIFNQTSTNRKRRKFPTWDGEKFSFNSFIHEVEDCIEIDRELMGSDRAIWYDINHSLPSKAKQKVSIFYASGYKINWNYRIFIDHLKRTFEGNQRFSDFFPFFDEAHAGAGGENWSEDNKVVWLRRSLSEALKDQLFTVELDPEGYYGSVRRIEAVAYRFENSRHFKGKKGPCQSIDIPSSNRNQLSAPRLDQDGDVIMSPMNSSGQGG
ncbi:hypothetical protein K3495_g11493 [Podosphaera aphanis]|nr:hypothetical protein K3495_g11493 [Podosphaera aphanis]